MSFLDNIAGIAKGAMGTVSSATAATTVTASLTKIAEEIQANPMPLVQNPMALVDKLKSMIPEGFDMSQLSGIVAMLPLPVEAKDGLTKLIDMATGKTEVPAQAEEVSESEVEMPTMPEAPATEPTPETIPQVAVEVPAMPETMPAVDSMPADSSVDM